MAGLAGAALGLWLHVQGAVSVDGAMLVALVGSVVIGMTMWLISRRGRDRQ